MPLEIFPYLPELVGHPNPVQIVLGKKSGRDSIGLKLRDLGLRAGDEAELDRILQVVKETAESQKRVLTDEEFKKIVQALRQPAVSPTMGPS